MTPRSRYFITHVLDPGIGVVLDRLRVVAVARKPMSKGGRGMTGDGIKQSILAGSEVGLRAGFCHRIEWTGATRTSDRRS
jgi:hypothetical protein